ncbi:MAG TPA: ATP-binding protein [Bacteroidales bacterium]|nr:ATP-binding protein [Bacteroidales bacterium]
MIFSRFRFLVIIQVVLLALTPVVFVWTLSKEYMLVTSSSLVIMWLAQIIYLIWYLQKINRDLIKFITSLQYDDVSLSFDKNKADKHFSKLYTELNNIIGKISEIRSIRESDYQFFQYTIKHIATGIIAMNSNKKIEICNDAALKILNLKELKNMEGLNTVKPGLSEAFWELNNGRNKLLKLNINNEIVQLSIKAADFKIKNQYIKLFSVQNIKSEIDHSEIDAWQKLIRVLTHEIMNSVSPIKLLSSSMIDTFEETRVGNKEIGQSTVDETILGLKTILKRSSGLSNFVENYKSLTQISRPKFTNFNVVNMLDQLKTLFNEEFKKQSIQFLLQSDSENIALFGDEKLIEQVLINLIKNSIEAIKETEKPEIKIRVYEADGRINILIADNGQGIKPEFMDNIFTPFFTTKEKGSGIGLSLSRQIMHLHGGNISVKSEPYVETVFRLCF